VGTRVIDDIRVAKSLINESFEILEKCSATITNKNLKFLI